MRTVKPRSELAMPVRLAPTAREVSLYPRLIDVLAADPPWKFKDPLPGDRGASKKYPCMEVDEIARYRIPAMAKDSMLFMWKVASMPDEALFVMRAWGFKPYGELVWRKMTVHGKVHFGMGRVVRNAHETCLIGIRGKKLPPNELNERSVFDGIVREHSAKPPEFYGLIERLYPHEAKCELFARTTRIGWDQEGNQLGILDPDRDGD